jgi:hypothetical protein
VLLDELVDGGSLNNLLLRIPRKDITNMNAVYAILYDHHLYLHFLERKERERTYKQTI